MLDEREDVLHGPGNDSSVRVAARVLKALHRVRFACSRLAIRQDGRIVAFEHGGDSVLRSAVVNMLLS